LTDKTAEGQRDTTPHRKPSKRRGNILTSRRKNNNGRRERRREGGPEHLRWWGTLAVDRQGEGGKEKKKTKESTGKKKKTWPKRVAADLGTGVRVEARRGGGGREKSSSDAGHQGCPSTEKKKPVVVTQKVTERKLAEGALSTRGGRYDGRGDLLACSSEGERFIPGKTRGVFESESRRGSGVGGLVFCGGEL